MQPFFLKNTYFTPFTLGEIFIRMEWSPNFLDDTKGLVPEREISVWFVNLFSLTLKKEYGTKFFYGWRNNPLFLFGGWKEGFAAVLHYLSLMMFLNLDQIRMIPFLITSTLHV
jgi:hypothetical protein